jgi:folylpolyglutamate synthase/dihydropteroate synthase
VLHVDLSAADSEHGVRSIPLIDTDALNSNLALLTLHLLQKHHPHALPQLDLQTAATARGLDARPPCRWEEHTYTDPASGVVVDVVLDMGHNPAALAALARRIAHKFPGREVRYAAHAVGYCFHTGFASFRHCSREVKFLLRIRCA